MKPLTYVERRAIKCLQRRLDHLVKRTDLNPSLSYDLQEAGVLGWAIRTLTAHDPAYKNGVVVYDDVWQDESSKKANGTWT